MSGGHRFEAGAASARYEEVARAADVPPGTSVQVTTSGGDELCVYNLGGSIGAVSNICTHQAFPLCEGTLDEDGSVQCAWHGARFDLATGEVLEGPAVEPLPVYDVRVENGVVMVGPRRNA